jgi:signal transduction histidine kinase
VAAAIALLAAATWLATPRIGYLVVATAATASIAVLAARGTWQGRRWRIATAASLVVFITLAVATERTAWRIERGWEAYNRDAVSRASGALDHALTSAAADLSRRAERALDAPSSAADAFEHLTALVAGSGEHGIVLYRGGAPLAWSGQVRVDPDTLHSPVGVVTSEFHTTLYAVAARGTDRAVATLLVEARPPADRLSEPLERLVATTMGVEDFEIGAMADSSALGYFVLDVNGQRLFGVSPVPLAPERAELAMLEAARLRGAIVLAVALILFIAVIWRATRSIGVRLGVLAVAIACIAIAPLNELSNASRLFDPAIYYAELGGPFTASVGAFALTAALVLLGLIALLRSPSRIRSRGAAIALVLTIAAGGPFLMRDLARGISPPAWGISTGLWLAWEIALFLVGVSVVIAGATAGRAALRDWRGLPPALAPSLAVAAGLIGPLVWDAPGRWPGWYPALWIAAIGALALTRRSRRFMLAASTVAALGAATLVWGNVARKRVELAEREVASLNDVDPTATLLLRRFGNDLCEGDAPLTRAAMLRRYVASDLAAANFPVAITSWSVDGNATETLSMVAFDGDSTVLRRSVAEAHRLEEPVLWEIRGSRGLQLLIAVPHPAGEATTVVIVPRTRPAIDDPFLALLGIGPESAREPPYTLTVTDVAEGPAQSGEAAPRWERRGNELHGDWTLAAAPRATRAHVEVELRPFDAMFQRGALVVLIDLLIIGLLWTLAAGADGGLRRWVSARRRVWARSYRARLTLVLFGFFVVPALIFALWSSRRLVSGDQQARELLVRETLRAVADEAIGDLATASQRFDTPLLLYAPGELRRTSDPLFQALAPLGRFLDPEVHAELVLSDEVTAARYARVGSVLTLIGYRAAVGLAGDRVVLGAPARTDELALDRRRRDLLVLVLFTTAVGALAALWLSGVAARQFAQPIRALREAALAIARGEREPALSGTPPAEFVPVFTAFRRMTADLSESRRALEEAQRRTAAILRNVASGVVAIDRAGIVTLANSRADALLGRVLPPGTPLSQAGSPMLAEKVAAFTARTDDDEEEFDVEIQGRQLHARLTRGGAGAVLTLDDVSELARAQRVLAWGEMARQVAHEIKNPLTPIRLGVQHLKRARAAGRGDFDEILDQNVARILAEIDRLDEIARAFSRYGTAPAEQAPTAPVDVADIVRDVVALETLGESAVQWRTHDADRPAIATASGDELREVLLNILENARLANARRVDIVVSREPAHISVVVADDGEGIAPDALPRIFEPHFSTRTSGSGLGLAISRRLIEGWGGSIAVTSERGKGTRVEIRLSTE